MIETAISTNENLVQVFCGVRGYEEDGVAYLHIEDVARGLGFTTVATCGNECVRWNRVDECLQDLNFLPLVAESGFSFCSTCGAKPNSFKNPSTRDHRTFVYSFLMSNTKKDASVITTVAAYLDEVL